MSWLVSRRLVVISALSCAVLMGLYRPAQAASGRTIQIPLQYPPVSIDPAHLIDTEGVWIASQIFEGLFTYSASGEIREHLVAKWWVTDEGKAYHFILRPGLRFSDGSALTSADVKFTLERLFQRSPRERAFLEGIEGTHGITLIDPQSLVIHLARPSPNFLAALATPYYAILPMHHRAAMNEGRFFQSPIGSGPYRMTSWDAQAIQLEANPFYRQPHPWVSTVTFRFIGGPRALTRAELDQYDLFVGLPVETRFTVPHFRAHIYMHPAVELITFNLRDPFWKEQSHRVGFSHLFNAQKFYEVLFENRTTSWHHTTSILPYGMSLNASSQETSPHIVESPQAVSEVKAYLARSGRNVLYFITHPHIRLEKLQRAVDAAMRESGLKIFAKKATPDEVMRDSNTPRMGLIATQIMADVPDPYEVLVNFSPDAAINYSGYTGFTAQLRATRNVAILDERARMYEQLARQLIDDRVVIPIASALNEKLLVKEDLHLETLSQLGPWYYALNQITPQRMH